MTDRHAIGGNNPPAHEAHAMNIEDLFKLISDSTASGEVTTDEQETALSDILKDIRKARQAADASRAAEKKPHDEAGRAVQAKYKPLLDRCTAAEKEVKELLTPYRAAKQAAKDEAQRKASEEAEAAFEAAKQERAAADTLEAKFEAEEALQIAGKQLKLASKQDRAPTGLRTYWRAEITDRRAALLHYIARQPSEFEALVQELADRDARGARGKIDGVTFHEEKRAA